MATSSIFVEIIIDYSDKIEKLIGAIELSKEDITAEE